MEVLPSHVRGTLALLNASKTQCLLTLVTQHYNGLADITRSGGSLNNQFMNFFIEYQDALGSRSTIRLNDLANIIMSQCRLNRQVMKISGRIKKMKRQMIGYLNEVDNN